MEYVISPWISRLGARWSARLGPSTKFGILTASTKWETIQLILLIVLSAHTLMATDAERRPEGGRKENPPFSFSKKKKK